MNNHNFYKFSLDAPIIPAKSLAGIIIGERIIHSDIQRRLEKLKAGSYKLDTHFVALYTLENGAVEVGVDVRNGKIYYLSGTLGYTGKLFDKITVGMKIGEAIKLVPSLYYSEREELVLCRGVAGVSIDPPEIDPPPSLVPDMEILAINIFAPQIKTPRGMDGFWDVMLEEERKLTDDGEMPKI